MNFETRCLELFHKSDFVFWENEKAIDWASDYEKEVRELVRLTIRECCWAAGEEARHKILKHFCLEK